MLATLLLLLLIPGLLFWRLRPHQYRWAGWAAATPPAIITAWLLLQIQDLHQGAVISEHYAWVPSLGLELIFRLDGLSLLFGLIIAGIGTGVALYTHYYLDNDPRQGEFYSQLFLFMLSMLGMVWSDNLLTLFVFWEGTSLTSFLLIGFNYQESRAREGARNALVLTSMGGLAMLAGMILLGQEAGSYTISQILVTPGLTESSVYPAAVLLIILGAFTKSAQFPFHFWLPGAMAAPTPASAYLHSATMVKAGIYLLARLHPALHDSPIWFWTLLIGGGMTMLLGAIVALQNTDMKALLAYATVSQLGILTMLLAFHGEIAYVAVVTGIIAHALYKGPLFLVAGIVDHATGTRDIRRLAGLWRPLPLTSIAALLSVVSMAGFPPFLGFLAKETLIDTSYHFLGHDDPVIGQIVLVASLVAGAFFVAYSLTLLWEVFLRRESEAAEQAHVHHRPVLGFVLAPLALSLLGLALPFVLDSGLVPLVAAAASAVAGATIVPHLVLWAGLTPVLIASLAAIGGGLILFALRTLVRRLLALMPARLNGAQLFQDLMDRVYWGADWIIRWVQGGTLASQSAVVMLAGVAALLAALVQLDPRSLVPFWTTGFQSTEIILAALAVTAAFTTIRAATRLSAIISLGAVGVIVTLFYVHFGAPDLALTQLLIEVLTLVLLVLVFYRIPPDRLPSMRPLRKITIWLVTAAAGLFGFGLVFLNAGIQIQASISDYFMRFSVPAAHGANVVNVILVDFRGFDTMGEITVLALAALGGYALLRAPRIRIPRITQPVMEDDERSGPVTTSPSQEERVLTPPVEPGPR